MSDPELLLLNVLSRFLSFEYFHSDICWRKVSVDDKNGGLGWNFRGIWGEFVELYTSRYFYIY